MLLTLDETHLSTNLSASSIRAILLFALGSIKADLMNLGMRRAAITNDIAACRRLLPRLTQSLAAEFEAALQDSARHIEPTKKER